MRILAIIVTCKWLPRLVARRFRNFIGFVSVTALLQHETDIPQHNFAKARMHAVVFAVLAVATIASTQAIDVRSVVECEQLVGADGQTEGQTYFRCFPTSHNNAALTHTLVVSYTTQPMLEIIIEVRVRPHISVLVLY